MPERIIVVEGLTITYEGLFNIRDLYDVMEHWFKERGYDKYEKKNFEQVLKDGRDIYIETWPTKALTDYARITMKIMIHVKKMKDVIVKKDNMDIKMNQGKVNVEFKGYLLTDWENRWDGKPLFYFLRTAFDRWVYPVNTSKWQAAVAEEVNLLYQTMKGYLNLNRY